MSSKNAALAVSQPGVFVAEVVASVPVCDEHFRLTLRAGGFPDAFPGQFVQVRCGSPDTCGGALGEIGETARDDQCFGTDAVAAHGRGRPFTRRPFSIGGMCRKGAEAEIELLYRVIGPGTTWMAGLRTGQRVSVIGPLGGAFRPGGDEGLSIVVGGGIGLPPVMWLGRVLADAGRNVVGVCGARSRRLLPVTAGATGAGKRVHIVEFGAVPVVVTTDDGSWGLKGTVVDGLRTVLAEARAAGTKPAVYACGPEKMLRAVASVAVEGGAGCQVCMERMMACGMGTCQSCVIRIRDDTQPDGWRYRLCCQDGPVFDAVQVVW